MLCRKVLPDSCDPTQSQSFSTRVGRPALVELGAFEVSMTTPNLSFASLSAAQHSNSRLRARIIWMSDQHCWLAIVESRQTKLTSDCRAILTGTEVTGVLSMLLFD